MKHFEEKAEANREELKESIRTAVSVAFEDQIQESMKPVSEAEEDITEEEDTEKKSDSEDDDDDENSEDDDEESDRVDEAAGRGKVIHTEKGGNKETKVYWSSQDQEYTVSLFVGGKHQKDADYFTDDKTDAKGTAKAMVK